ncbi:amphi-Trp domain-containing protein [Planctobacterium marinum]|uniref:amphi-Trp domain-containing protein n=1 Tax=Planctobacterium marinum TaxID=1631968 RepID=UPI001E63E421|nr:amphi-Trp domain-containing protein [Planctobacterium marinum]MCC2606695.1 amphi-Trp domain-containing protein [Planctobacterium marinum]
MEHKSEFRHESLQDGKSIQKLLEAISKGLGKGKLEFSDEDGKLALTPKGLLDLKITVKEDESRHKLDIRVSWNKQNQHLSESILKVK